MTEPQGIEVRLRGGGGGSGDWHADATSDTDLSVAALERHYAAQLEAAGWTQRSMSADEDIAWSLWDIPPARLPNGRGMLTVVKTPDGRSRWLHVSAHGDRDD